MRARRPSRRGFPELLVEVIYYVDEEMNFKDERLVLTISSTYIKFVCNALGSLSPDQSIGAMN